MECKMKKFMRSTVIILMLSFALTFMVHIVFADIRCDQLVGSCQGTCITQGECPWYWYGHYGGQIVGCDNGDSRININDWHSDARAYLESLGYTPSLFGYYYSDRDYTDSINGHCRWQAIVSADNHYVQFKDGPEPNPQPWFCSDGNPDLGWPWATCVISTVQHWHDAC